MLGVARMLNEVPETTALSGEGKRVVVSLFADDADDKLAWTALLTSTATGFRSWAHAKHEVKEAASGVKETVRGQRSASGSAQREVHTVLVTIPAGMRPGEKFQVQTPSGMRWIPVPPGASPGQSFNAHIPA